MTPDEDAAPDEPASPGRLFVGSEVGTLRRVILHRPDLELKRLTPSTARELLFDGVIWVQREDVAYFFSSRDPILLGIEGDYRFDRAIENRYVQLHGAPTIRGALRSTRSQLLIQRVWSA